MKGTPKNVKKTKTIIKNAAKRHWAPLLFVIFIIVEVLLINFNDTPIQTGNEANGVIFGNDVSSRAVEKYFNDLADKKGAQYAFTVLKKSTIKNRIDTHTLGHLIGYKLYDQKGLSGITKCTPEFTYSCFHGVIISAFVTEGISVANKLAVICASDPAKSDLYQMCYHGLGHGAVAYTNYNLEKAIEFCKEKRLDKYNNLAYKSCVAGAVMETYLGLHDKKAWKDQYPKYFKDNDALSPCDTPLIEDEVKPTCYAQLSLYFLKLAGLNQEKPDPNPTIFENAFTYCDAIPKEQKLSRDKCYGAFGEVFVGLARKAQDLNKLPENTDYRLQVYKWCMLAHDNDGRNECIKNTLITFYVLLSNKDSAFLFCQIIPKKADQNICYTTLSTEITKNARINNLQREEECLRLPFDYRNTCHEDK